MCRFWNYINILQIILLDYIYKSTVATGWSGLGYFPSCQIDKAKGKRWWDSVSKEPGQGGITHCCGWSLVGSLVGWHVLHQIFGSSDTLPSPANLHTWGRLRDLPVLCAGSGSLKQHLSSCPKALANGRYCWRHNQVLKAVLETVTTAIQTSQLHPRRRTIPFFKAGEKTYSKQETGPGQIVQSSLIT